MYTITHSVQKKHNKMNLRPKNVRTKLLCLHKVILERKHNHTNACTTSLSSRDDDDDSDDVEQENEFIVFSSSPWLSSSREKWSSFKSIRKRNTSEKITRRKRHHPDDE